MARLKILPRAAVAGRRVRILQFSGGQAAHHEIGGRTRPVVDRGLYRMMQFEAEVLDMCSSRNQADALHSASLRTEREAPTDTASSLRSDQMISSSLRWKSPHRNGLTGQTRRTALWVQRMASAALAFFASALAPALVMTAIWRDTRLAPMVFAFTLIIALSHAVLIGLSIFLVCLWRRRMDIGSCVFLGSLIGVVPAGILTFPAQHVEFHASAWHSSMPIVVNELLRSAISGSYIEPLAYCGLLGALGGFVFWTVLISSGAFGRYSRSHHVGTWSR
ncbi:hypothetical protein I6F35_15485 [Bradyrhizobium sp. BRP22]|uniref:hypothetical protein n=1 Tax=Bradyrhizobium sp. BRP22 TaxID=2793821 RepID=UPI001CD57C87|nr:hypothetical protein [Bradyrhizobium sp. BRP22]MCA1454612.1 hypothetical protein [Bradyrhizobium sp. BRP22]